MVHGAQMDMESAPNRGEADNLISHRRKAAPVAQPAAMSPLPLLLASGIVLLICMLLFDNTWELPMIQSQHGTTSSLSATIRHGLVGPLHAAAHGRPAISGFGIPTKRKSTQGYPPTAPPASQLRASESPLESRTKTGASSATADQPPPAVVQPSISPPPPEMQSPPPPLSLPSWPPPVEMPAAAVPAHNPLEVRIHVVPTFSCQAVSRKLEMRCEKLGATAAEKDKHCKAAVSGQYSSSYLAPFVAIAEALRTEFGFVNYQVEATLAGLEDQAELASGSWTNGTLADADVIIVEEGAAQKLLKRYPEKKFIVVQQPAHATLSATMENFGTCARFLLADNRVLAYLQHTALQPLTLNNLPRISKSIHYYLLNSTYLGHQNLEALIQAVQPPAPAFTDALLEKVFTLVPLVWRWRHPVVCHGNTDYLQWMTPALREEPEAVPDWLPPLDQRPVDVAFTGSRSPGAWKGNPVSSALYTQHRGLLNDELVRFKAAHPELRVEIPDKLKYSEFAQLLRRTKIFISPWGFGEYSGKDLETVISRTVLMKPLASIITGYPNIYEPDRTCLEVAIDFSNLEAVVLSALADMQKLQAMADEAHRRVVGTTERTMASDVAAVLHKVIT